MVQDAAEEGGEAGREVTALLVRHLNGRQARIHDDTDDGDDGDVCIVYEPDTVPAAADWLIAERQLARWCKRSEAMAEIVAVTISQPADPADLEAALRDAARTARVSYGFVRSAELYAEVG